MCFCLPVLFVPIVLVLGFELNTDIYCLVLGWPLHDLCTGAAGCHGLFHQSSRDCLFGHFSFPLVPILFGLANQHVWSLDLLISCQLGLLYYVGLHVWTFSHSIDLNCLVDGTHDPYQHFKQCLVVMLCVCI